MTIICKQICITEEMQAIYINIYIYIYDGVEVEKLIVTKHRWLCVYSNLHLYILYHFL